MRSFQKGFNVSQDGPGNRLVYHLQGCNLRCPWCANPEGLALQSGKEYTVDEIAAEVLANPKKYAPNGVYIMRIHGTFVNFLDLSPAIQEDIILRLDPGSTAC